MSVYENKKTKLTNRNEDETFEEETEKEVNE